VKKAIGLAIAIFLADILMPFGIAIAVLYTLCILLVVRASRRNIMIIAVLATVFSLIKFLYYLNQDTAYYFIVNRGIALIAIWATTFLALKFSLLKRQEKMITRIHRQNKESEQFLYIASHDLNEPLRTIKGLSDLLNERYKALLDSDGQELLHYIGNSADRMGSLIRSLLDYGRIGRQSQKKAVRTQALVDAVCADLSQLIHERNAIITYRNLPIVQAYPEELRLMFQNLITNAIKFSKPGHTPEIHISAQSKGRAWHFAVRDNGMGIRNEHLDKIFTIFKKLHSPDDYAGTGIGLAHCRKIAELHGGDIWAESEIDIGTTFYFTIPT
jgi:light-regulated signal transduction histidine kinase (bacteriophytochrome)